MSEVNEALKANDVFDGVPVYRVMLVRESTVAELPNPVRKAIEAAAILRPLFAGLDREQFVVLLLDAQHSPIGINIVSIGSLTASIVHTPRSIQGSHSGQRGSCHRCAQPSEWFGRAKLRGHRTQSSAP